MPTLVFLALAMGPAFFTTRANAIVSISPVQPTAQDTVTVVAVDGFSSLCWNDVGQSCDSTRPDTLAVTVDVQYCDGGPPCNCGQFPQGYRRACSFGRLLPGSYVAIFTEHHLNSADPKPSFTQSLRFSVGASTPALRRTWGELKQHYR